MEDRFWGKRKENNPIEVRFDPLQSFLFEEKKVGFRVHLVPLRKERPRELILPSTKLKPNPSTSEDSVLLRIVKGSEKSIPITGDQDVIGDCNVPANYHDLSQYRGVTVVNKFSPLELGGISANGISLVSFPTTLISNLDHEEPVYHLLCSLKTAINYLLEKHGETYRLTSSLVFMNIGSSSGASLQHLHAQTYIVPENSGLVSHSFQRAFDSNEECLVCRIVDKKVNTDHLGQALRIEQRVIWEDQFVTLLVPFAPIRVLSLRLFIKEHISWIGALNNTLLESIAKGITLAHKLMKNTAILGRRIRADRSLVIRQSIQIDRDFHMFIDVLPAIPYGGAELVDSLSISTIIPEVYAAELRNGLLDLYTGS
ncbi:MAG: hypothetical protein ACW98K_10025 [Candidatus Kariarchaeaceae archaeon]|jgi:diadenosine tetraphosphate (Ap4A) HIT family hydrolase